MNSWSRSERYKRIEDVSDADFASLRRQVKASVWRQTWHIQPPTGLLNDPNGFCYWRGRYHLSYQWFPLGAVHGLKYWRHLSSPDGVSWQNEGILLAPDTPYDSHGAYSGSAISHPRGLLIAYTGNVRDEHWNRTAHQILALYDGKNLQKCPPFLSGSPQGYTEHIRDPKLWQDEDGYGVVLGAQRENKTGTVLIYRSTDLKKWLPHGEMNLGLDLGYMWECPDFFKLDKKDVLIFCPQGVAAAGMRQKNVHLAGYVMGSYDPHTQQFTHEGFHELDFGFDFYAPQTTLSANGERLMVAWLGLPDTIYPTDADGWAGCLSLPRVLSVEDEQLRQRPLPALSLLRGKEQKLSGTFTGNVPLNGTSYELHFYPMGGKDDWVIHLRTDTTHRTVLRYEDGVFSLDRLESGLLPISEKDLPANKDLTLRQVALENVTALQIFVDVSSVEVFLNDGECVLSARLFPPKEADGIEVFGTGELIFYPLTDPLTGGNSL